MKATSGVREGHCCVVCCLKWECSHVQLRHAVSSVVKKVIYLVFGGLSGQGWDFIGCNLTLNCLATYFSQPRKGRPYRLFNKKKKKTTDISFKYKKAEVLHRQILHINTMLHVSNSSMWQHTERSNVWLRIIVKAMFRDQQCQISDRIRMCLNLVGKRNTDILIYTVG